MSSSAQTATVNTSQKPTSPALSGVLKAAARDSKLRGVVANVGERSLHIQGPDGVWPFVVGTVAQHAPVLVVTPSGRQAQDLTTVLKYMLGSSVEYFPAWETLPHERLSPGTETVSHRMRVLRRLATDSSLKVVVAPTRALVQPIQKDLGEVQPIQLKPGVEIDFEDLQHQLVALGYQHVDVVAKRGHFAIRGGIVDVYPATEDLPVRVDFWGDEISEVRAFSVGDQRTIDGVDDLDITVYACRELLLTDELAARAAQAAQEHAQVGDLAEFLDKISQKMQVAGMESVIPLLRGEQLVSLPELMPEGTHTVIVSPGAVERRAVDLDETGRQFMEAGWEVAAAGGDAPMQGVAYMSLLAVQKVQEKLRRPWWTLSAVGMLDGLDADDAQDDALTLDYDAAPAPHGDLDAIGRVMADIRRRVEGGGRVVFAAPTPAVAARMIRRLNDAGLPNEAVGVDLTGQRLGRLSKPTATTADEPAGGKVWIYHAVAHVGVDFPFAGDDAQASMLFLTETDLTGNRVDAKATGKRKPAKKRNRVDPLALEPGDLVVHDSHGIGKFVKMTERTIGKPGEGSRREYLVLEYAPSKRGGPGDQLYVPMDQLDLLSRYVGGEKPALSKMGGADWKNTKRKARGAVREIAGELVQLYAARQAAPGYAFAADSPWQRELEEAFPYTETEDQWNAIEAVKADMEKPVPMDRVIVGDVGYGKTEVAVRAAFKAVQSGKQVAVLVPTTLLAQQHLKTFQDRMQDFPTTIRELSRFTSAKESKEILAGLADGTIDIVIGTHRLIQTGVTWKNLGLIVVDEEQRFGVEHKEHIKSLRTHVDVLTMSATPIPRTLEMSMAGIREMSTILTPPEDRHPVLTYVGAQEDKHVAAAIRRELLRDGQVFYVHNKVRSIEDCAANIRRLVPEARVVVAHGQMSEEQLETTVQGFWDREFDVLVCTTIVETGLDIANANTLIVENAHHMGLSQLHQLRGRVGRSRERGYAYFLYPRGETLTETSYDRLTTIAQNNDLGAGMAVAMKDLEMRGAGNVLGAEQSGHIAGVGFDLYVRLVGEAVEAFRAIADGKPVDGTEEEKKEIRLDLPVDAHIPAEYIASERLRLEAYRKFAEITDEEGIHAVLEELRDRYGTPPEQIQLLAILTRLRMLCRDLKVHDIVLTGQKISFSPIDLADSGQVRLKRLFRSAQYRATTKIVLIPLPKKGEGMRAVPLAGVELVQWCSDVLTQLAGIPARDMTGAQPAHT
ncbi:transcription-repair coupling factor [Corynebacterium sp. 320]|uniref:transcription-repair coupling factor n=1 Tax=Corynebacterium TaxID=1716 RepID=UPI00125CD1E2|nr:MULTISPECIES: transcription-repair coupling factor [Corynebacterium]KAB1504050.1 transcription-repair coupling factor [Corynebacterium sp. 320]KAB1552851.1 transcription-repair coupling factor [Corynebacterium sp. 321]KAB1553931.1 transcription-repair coupling factor [Corynebacterium sp. 319]KAB3528186.1 transcription-repair coupling factor [Corynebacterium sp. 250]KAB3540326.1 transcription-repair coupling factor [Corynebacterium sp. 366]